MQKVTLKYVNGIWFEIFFTVLICIALLIFTFDFINRENFIYFWDYSGYWVRYQGLMDSFSKFSLDAIGRVLSSVRYKEYNLLPVSLLLPSGMVLGESRMAYVIGNTIVFTFPFVILFAYFFERRINAESKFNNSRIAFTIALLCLAFSPQLWVPVLCGYLGAGGLILAVVVLLNYFCKPFNEQSYSSILFMALLLCVMVIFRRWYAYWVVGFLLSITIVQVITLARAHRTTYRNYLPTLVKLFMLGTASFVFFVLLATPQAIKMLTTNFADIYSGYKRTTSFLDVLGYLISYFGPLTIVSASFGFFFSLRDSKYSNVAFVLFLQFWLSLILFTNTQSMGYHHHYILLPSMFFFVSYFWIVFVASFKKRMLTLLAFSTMLAFLALNFFIVVSPSIAAALEKVDFAFSELRHFPMNREDIGEIENVIKYIDERSTSDTEGIYVLASSYILNDDILRNGCRASVEQYSICNSFEVTAHVDKRDGLPFRFFQSKYIITTEPAQFHLHEKDQQVIGLLRDELMSGKGVGANYMKLDVEFTLDQNVRVLVYQRSGEVFYRDDLDGVSGAFVKMYPNHKKKFLFPTDLLESITE